MTLPEVLGHIAELSPTDIPAVLAACAAKLAQAPAAPAEVSGHADSLLDIEAAAQKLSVTPEWLYRRGKRLGLAVKLAEGTLRFSSNAIEAYIRDNRVQVVPRTRKKPLTSVIR